MYLSLGISYQCLAIDTRENTSKETMMREFFLDYILPALVVISLCGSLLYTFCAYFLYSYLQENYSDALPQRVHVSMSDDESLGGFIIAIMHVSRTGGWKRIQSKPWRKFYIGTRVLGLISALGLALLCAAFVFWPV